MYYDPGVYLPIWLKCVVILTIFQGIILAAAR